MINQLSYVTRKLQHHTINETSQNEEKVVSEDRDSGTESDDETTLEDKEIASEMSSDVSSGCSVKSRPTSQTSTDTLTCDEIPMAGECSEIAASANQIATGYLCHHSLRGRRGARTPRFTNIQQVLKVDSAQESPRNESPIDSFLDSAVLRECDNHDPVEQHSSEEELETLTGPSEKRKWSQVGRLSLTDSGSSDDEVFGLTTGKLLPVQFRTSPPLEVHKPLRTISPPSKILSLSAVQCHAVNGVGSKGYGAQQRKCCFFKNREHCKSGTIPKKEASAYITST